MACGLQNGRGQPESVFLCFLHLQWINLFFAVSPLHGLSFLQNTTPQKEQKQTNKKPRNLKFHQKKRAPTQETKKQRNKTNCTPKTGEDAENWVPSCFLFCLFFWFIVFLVPCFFWRAGRTKKVAGPNLLLLLPA